MRARWLKKAGPLVLALGVGAVGAAMLSMVRTDLFVAGGSDSLSSFYRPPAWAQDLALAMLGVSVWGASRGSSRSRGASWLWGLSLAVSLAAFAMSLRVLTMDGRKEQLRSVWLLWTTGAVPYRGEQGIPRSALTVGPLFLTVDDRQGGREWFFLGVLPWRVDAQALLAHPLVTSPWEDGAGR